jgi:hypothetical protein
MDEPGGLSTLDQAGLVDWNERLQRQLTSVIKKQGENHRLLPSPSTAMVEVTTTDWVGLPARIARCVGRHQALEFLDWRREADHDGRYLGQEEYIEWRVIRGNGAIQRVEMTTELSDYWLTLAACDPQQVLDLTAEFARQSVEASEVFGELDPFAAATTPAEREQAFAHSMLCRNVPSALNRGSKAICCMVQPTNNLRALLNLSLVAAEPGVTTEPSGGAARPMTASEAIPLMPGAAQLGRNSDPILVERLGRVAYEGRQIAFDDPLGIYIIGVERDRLRLPDDSPVPDQWLNFQRGVGPEEAEDRRPRYQRLVVEAPPGSDLSVGDLHDAATEQPIQHGGQVAELVQLGLYLRVTPAGALSAETEPVPAQPEDPPELGCSVVNDWLAEFMAAQVDEGPEA